MKAVCSGPCCRRPLSSDRITYCVTVVFGFVNSSGPSEFGSIRNIEFQVEIAATRLALTTTPAALHDIRRPPDKATNMRILGAVCSCSLKAIRGYRQRALQHLGRLVNRPGAAERLFT